LKRGAKNDPAINPAYLRSLRINPASDVTKELKQRLRGSVERQFSPFNFFFLRTERESSRGRSKARDDAKHSDVSQWLDIASATSGIASCSRTIEAYSDTIAAFWRQASRAKVNFTMRVRLSEGLRVMQIVGMGDHSISPSVIRIPLLTGSLAPEYAVVIQPSEKEGFSRRAESASARTATGRAGTGFFSLKSSVSARNLLSLPLSESDSGSYSRDEGPPEGHSVLPRSLSMVALGSQAVGLAVDMPGDALDDSRRRLSTPDSALHDPPAPHVPILLLNRSGWPSQGEAHSASAEAVEAVSSSRGTETRGPTDTPRQAISCEDRPFRPSEPSGPYSTGSAEHGQERFWTGATPDSAYLRYIQVASVYTDLDNRSFLRVTTRPFLVGGRDPLEAALSVDVEAYERFFCRAIAGRCLPPLWSPAKGATAGSRKALSSPKAGEATSPKALLPPGEINVGFSLLPPEGFASMQRALQTCCESYYSRVVAAVDRSQPKTAKPLSLASSVSPHPPPLGRTPEDSATLLLEAMFLLARSPLLSDSNVAVDDRAAHIHTVAMDSNVLERPRCFYCCFSRGAATAVPPDLGLLDLRAGCALWYSPVERTVYLVHGDFQTTPAFLETCRQWAVEAEAKTPASCHVGVPTGRASPNGTASQTTVLCNPGRRRAREGPQGCGGAVEQALGVPSIADAIQRLATAFPATQAPALLVLPLHLFLEGPGRCYLGLQKTYDAMRRVASSKRP